MNRSQLLAGVLATLSIGTVAYGDDDDCHVPMAEWQTREAVQNMAKARGWDRLRIRIDDGCYEVQGHDASGRKIEARINPATLMVIQMETANHKNGDDNEDSETTTPGN